MLSTAHSALHSACAVATSSYHPDQYLFGDSFLVAPVYSPTSRRTVYLPAGKWYNFWTGAAESGPKTLHLEPELEELPLYVRSDSIIPMGPDMAFVGERPFDPITLDIWLDHEAECTIYDDSGDTEEIIRCRAQRQDRQTVLEIGPSNKGFIGEFRQIALPAQVSLDGAPLPRVAARQELEAVDSAWFVDTMSTTVKCAATGDARVLAIQH